MEKVQWRATQIWRQDLRSKDAGRSVVEQSRNRGTPVPFPDQCVINFYTKTTSSVTDSSTTRVLYNKLN